MNSYIPPNIDQSGYVFYGMFKTRNFVEAAISGLITFNIVFKFLSFFLSYTLQLTISLIVTIAVAFFFLYGLDDKSVITALSDRYRFRSRKGIVTLGVPMPESNEEKRAFLRKKKKEDENAYISIQ